MGQYYKPVALETKQFVLAHSYDNGLKLMEHSWVGNHFVAAVESLISKGGDWFGKKIVWAGDYADGEIGKDGKPLLDENRSEINLYDLAEEELHPEIDTEKEHKPLRYIKNLDTNEYVDIRKVPADKKWGWQIHPLPLLTCEGNGRGGGDYYGESELIGKWARNRVVMQKSKPKNCTELVFDLTEN